MASQSLQYSRLPSKTPLLTLEQLAGGFYTFKYLLAQINFDPEAEEKEQSRLKSAAILRRLDQPRPERVTEEEHGRPRLEELRLNTYEQAILQDVVFSEDIPVSFEDIGGLSHIIEELRESVIYPLTMPKLYTASSSLLAAPSGVLLYGPPGCVSQCLLLTDFWSDTQSGQNNARKSAGP